MAQALIVAAARTAVGRRHGRLKDVHPVVLGASLMRSLLERVRIPPEAVDQVIWGCVTQVGEQATNIGRNTWLATGFPVEVPAMSLDMQCGSSEQAVNLAAALIESGVSDLVLAGGVESMTRVPMGSDAATGSGGPFPPVLLERFDLVPQGLSAQLMADKYGITREEMDRFSVRSHELAAGAVKEGRLASQIVPVSAGDGEEPFQVDEGIRYNATLEALSGLKPAFDPTHQITAGNSSQISDGAAALLIASPERARELALEPRARILAQATVGTDPVLMLEGPIPATERVLTKAGLKLGDIDLFEVNEAFASVPLAWLKVTGADPERLNVNGGAIAIGHPLGASGARLMNHLLYEMERRGARLGLQTMCVGGGIGVATVIDRRDLV